VTDVLSTHCRQYYDCEGHWRYKFVHGVDATFLEKLDG